MLGCQVYLLSDSIYNFEILYSAVRKASDIDLSTKRKHPIAVLSKLVNGDMDDSDLIKNSELVQKHFHCIFCVMCENELIVELLEKTKLQITRHEAKNYHGIDVSIISATLDVWKEAILTCSRKGSQTLKFANAIQQQMENIGLSLIFSKYTKVSTQDGYYLK